MSNSIGNSPHANSGIVTTKSDLTGQRFTRLVVVEQRGFVLQGRANGSSRQSRRKLWLCRCDCGNEVVLTTNALTRGNSKSCGCLKIDTAGDARRTHGQSGKNDTAEYRAWCLMKGRCNSPEGDDYHRYGALGIKVCERWLNSFENFFADVGPRPSPKYSLDRISCDGDYEPGNVRWATSKTQNRNKSSSRFLTFQGETLTLAEWSERTGVPYKRIQQRLLRGLPMDRVLDQRRFSRWGVYKGIGSSQSPELRTWYAMKDRCLNLKSRWYSRYGGSGIGIAERWLGEGGFQNFLADMGPKPSPKHSLERKDNASGYSPENCCWATATEQARNTGRNKFLTHNGETLCVSEWAERLGIPVHILHLRLYKHGWTVEKTLSTPVRAR